MNALVFAYPIAEYIEHGIDTAQCYVVKRVSKFMMTRDGLSRKDLEEMTAAEDPRLLLMRREHHMRTRQILRQTFQGVFNRAIEERYRNQDYRVYWVMFDQHQYSPLITIQPDDVRINAAMSFKEHTHRRPDGTYPYPDFNKIPNHIADAKKVVVAGYHIKDCVDKIAAACYRSGHETLVDEELTEYFWRDYFRGGLRVHKYPSVVPPYMRSKTTIDKVTRARRKQEQSDKPWLYQWKIKEKPLAHY